MAPRKTDELKFTIDPKSGVPYYKQIILQIEMAIADNRLQQGNQLPTVRSLAVDLKINPNTVAKAYNQLEIRGIVTTQQGTGTFISEKEIKMDEIEREKILSQMSRDFLSKVGSYGFSIQDVIDHLQELQERE
ncbi:MAG: GntR family transcriptional regulator [Spirochaetota bacterium]